jgi:hypothetical protein
VNKSISKRRARYLSHKLLPGVFKGQGLGWYVCMYIKL